MAGFIALFFTIITCHIAMAQVFTGNPDYAGINWKGVIALSELGVIDWESRINQLGGNTDGLMYSINSGSLYLSKNVSEIVLDTETYLESMTNVTLMEDSDGVYLMQLDYFVFTTDPNITWYPFDELPQSQLIHSNIQWYIDDNTNGTSSRRSPDKEWEHLNIIPSSYIDQQGQPTGKQINKRSYDLYVDFTQPSYTNTNGQQTCYAYKNYCVNAQSGYKQITGLTYVSKIYWMVGWSHHFCQYSCSDNYYQYISVYHANQRYSVTLNGCKNIYSGGMANQIPAPGSGWGKNQQQVSCGPWNGNLPSCDRMPIGSC